MQLLVLLATMVVMGGCAHSDEWTKRDTWMQIGISAVLAADAYTTTKIRKTPGMREVGMAKHFLGSTPEPADTYLFFCTLGFSQYLITRALPAEWRPYYQGSIIIRSGWMVYKNCENGLC